MRRTIQLLALMAVLTALAGCALCSHCRCCPSAAPETPLPVVPRAAQDETIQDLALSIQPSEPPDDLPPAAEYRALPPRLCQCLAAKHAPLADGLDSQRRLLEQEQAKQCCLCGRKSEKQRAFQESMLLYSALESRNDASGQALQWYYQLAGGEAKADLLNKSMEPSRDLLERAKRMKQQGLTLPAPLEEYQRQVVELQLQQTQNQLSIEQLNSKLILALGYESQGWRIWPEPGKEPGIDHPPEVEAAVHFGLGQRPQLLLLRSMIANLDRDTLKSARSFLPILNPLLAMSSPGANCKVLKMTGKIVHIQPGQEDEVERIRAQLIDYLRERERAVAAEIREAVYEIRARRQATILARQASDSWQTRINALQKERAEGLRGVVELNKMYLNWYKARGEVVTEFLGWRIAGAKLKMAQGLLPVECGYTAESHCCGP